ncbi:MAG: hypothetical protein F6K24_36295 [Okeania sp. SIO2D1]|uniref:hypothetical protein n=1 Tax=Okeania sp. SIO2C9 TaxID=2607791 RepID=UPI0013B7220C|nr:hypothetical protein [Okeania sp. SIO2C9]NEQ72909.1 hypothetical protein [Okeania sp. SIO2C9]NES70289.1 hypothetical protein [Okeania sp. SIO2D1]
MINKVNYLIFAIVLILLSVAIPNFNLPVANAGNILSGFSLSAQNDWQITVGESQKSADKLALDLQESLNCKRNEIGKLAILIIHPHGEFDRTEPISLAEREGGGSVLEMKIHWHRKLPFMTRNHLTIIDWEILHNRHFGAAVILDDAILSPIHPQELNNLFKELLPDNL